MKMRSNFNYLALFLLVTLISAATLYLRGSENERRIIKEERRNPTRKNPEVLPIEEKIIHQGSGRNCNLFSGRWVLDETSSYPLYEEKKCCFMLDDFACTKYGRKDLKYQKWRWQPHDCDLPRFNAKALMEKIRGKKLIFVGDSLNENMWISMLCLIESAINPSSPRSVIRTDNLLTFYTAEFNATIGFYWSPLLVESNCDDPENHRIEERIFRVNSIEKHAKHWNDADFLIFDAFLWWLDPTMTILWGSFGSPDAMYSRVGMKLRRLEMTLSTWSNWLEININRNRTKLFFMSISPYHKHGETWDVKQNCYNQTEPISKEEYWGIATDRDIMHVIESAIQNLEIRGVKVQYLNITNLSDYRKDGHPSIYRKFHHPPNEQQLKDPKSYADCFHWCLPGVPDVWNEILYSYIMST